MLIEMFIALRGFACWFRFEIFFKIFKKFFYIDKDSFFVEIFTPWRKI